MTDHHPPPASDAASDNSSPGGEPSGTIPFVVIALVVTADRRVVAIEGSGGEWHLPRFRRDDGPRPLWQEVAAVNRGLARHYGIDAVTLRCLDADYDDADGTAYGTYELVARELPSDRGDLRLVPGDMPGGTWADERDRRAVRTWLTRPDDPVTPPWAEPTWFAEAAAWLTTTLVHVGAPPVGPVEQVRCWERSAILRVPTTTGPMFLKAVPDRFGREIGVTTVGVARAPDAFVIPAAVDMGRRWTVTAAFPGPTLIEVDDLATWERAAAALGRLQLEAVDWTNDLVAVGLPRRPVAALASDLMRLLGDDSALLLDTEGGLTSGERDSLLERMPAVHRDISALERAGVPLSLEHGDFWAGNVVVERRDADERFRFFDWSDASLAVPFFSLTLFLLDAMERFGVGAGTRERLLSSYAGAWDGQVLGAVRPAMDAALRIAPLHHAVTTYDHVLAGMRARWQMERMVPFYLKLALGDLTGGDH